MATVVYRRRPGALVPIAAILVALTMLRPSEGSWTFVVVFCLTFGLLSARQRLVCAPEGVDVTGLATRRVPWSEIREFRAGSLWRGGTQIVTSSGSVWSPAPSSWWGGPPSARDIAALEAARPRP